MNLTSRDNVQYSTLRGHVLQWGRSQQTWATSKGLCQWTLIESKMPKEKVRRARMTIRRAKVKMPRAKERKGKEIRKEKKVITRVRAKAKIKKAKACQHATLVESQDILLKTVGEARFDR